MKKDLTRLGLIYESSVLQQNTQLFEKILEQFGYIKQSGQFGAKIEKLFKKNVPFTVAGDRVMREREILQLSDTCFYAIYRNTAYTFEYLEPVIATKMSLDAAIDIDVMPKSILSTTYFTEYVTNIVHTLTRQEEFLKPFWDQLHTDIDEDIGGLLSI